MVILWGWVFLMGEVPLYDILDDSKSPIALNAIP